MTKPANRVSASELLVTIEGLLHTQPRTTDELAKLVGYAPGTVRVRLSVLEERGLAHRQGRTGILGMQFVWHFGAKPLRPAATGFRLTPRRDPLVAALFGATGVRS